MNKHFSNLEIVTLTVYLLGGESNYVDLEDVAIKVNELAPGRFAWKKYPDQINIEHVRTSLSDAKKSENGGYVLGSVDEGFVSELEGRLGIFIGITNVP